MSAPFIFVTTHTLNEGVLDEYMAQDAEFRSFLEENEPDLLDYQVYMDEGQSEVTFIFVFRDAGAADHHMKVANELIGRGLGITQTSRLEVYGGTPGSVLGAVLEANAEAGVPVSIKAQALGGFSRTRTARNEAA
ncbi:MAG TPA: hypothetical protein VF377_01115 [Acidimicrobiia bacterium]|jgi:hypothetical protein